MSALPRPWQRDAALAGAAAAELASREKHYPGMVDRGEIDRALAREDLAAWSAIAALFHQGEVETGDLSWTDLHAATRRAIASREAACAAKPADAFLEQRMAMADLIHRQIARSRHAALDAAMPARPATQSLPFAAEVPRRSQHGSTGTGG